MVRFKLRYESLRGCSHNYIYCDGRDEKYNVEGTFGKDIEIKINAIELLRRELDPSRKRKPFNSGFFLVGGGVCDSYEPVEKKFQLTRKALELLEEFNHPIHMLTKSVLIERDIELIKKINQNKRAIVSMSFSSVDDKISSVVEPAVPPPSARLKTLVKFKSEGITCGMFLMPVIPFLTDTPGQIEASVKAAKATGLDFIVFGGMTLKDGRQKDYFISEIRKHYPELIGKYKSLYPPGEWGHPGPGYYDKIHKLFYETASKYKMPIRIPAKVYSDILSENDLVTIMLEQIDYYSKLRNENSPYSYAAYSISKLDKPLRLLKTELKNLKGVGSFTEKIILEILETGKSSYYDKLVYFE
ncbi:MAG: hypothetical protein PVH88_20770 [Ignavibacteria bacterium]|jgi:DNA repair photolyase